MTPAPGSGATRFIVEYRAGESIFEQGDLGCEMFIVHEGEVEIVQAREGRTDHLARLEKGDFFGEMSLLEDLPRLATARALTTVKLVRVDNEAFDKILRKDPEIAIRIMRKLSRRLREIDEQMSAPEAEAPAASPSGRAATPELALWHADSRTRFPLAAGSESVVGRHDPVTGLRPDIDLGPLDPDRSSSRKHARIYYRDGALHVVEEVGTTNGTFLNGTRLEAGRPQPIAAGDQLRFGLVEVVVTDEPGD